MNLFVENAQKEMQVTIDTDCLLNWSTSADSDNMGSTAGVISGDVDLGVTNTPVTIDNAGTNSNAVDFLLDLELVVREQNVTEQMWVVVPNWYCSSMKAGDLRRADITGDGTGVIRSGLMGEVNGMTVYASNNLPSGGGTATDETTVLAGTKEALTFALQLTESEVVRIPTSFGDYSRGLMVYGRSTPQPTALATGIINRG